MSIALITASAKMRNGVYCCAIHETKYIVDILCTGNYSSQQREKFMYEKCFFQTYTAIFHFFEKLFYYYEFKLRNIYKNTCASFYISMMKPEAATGGVL